MFRSRDAVSDALSREAQIQKSLKHAIATGDRAVAMPLLLDAAERLGFDLQQEDPDTLELAHKTMRLLVEISSERARREAGEYGSTSVIEELSGTTSFEHINNLRDEPVNRDALNGAFGSSAPRFLATARINAIPTRLAYLQDAVSASSHILNDEDAPAPLLPKIVAEAVRRPLPQLRIDIDIFDDQMKQQLLNPLAMKVSEAFDMYIAVKRAGYGDEFHMTQKRLPLRGAKFEKNTYPGLKVARKFWVALLDDCEGSPPGFNGVWP